MIENRFCGMGNCAEAILLDDTVYVMNNRTYDGAYYIPVRDWEAHKQVFRDTVATGIGVVAAHDVLVQAASGAFDPERRGLTHDVTEHFSPEELAGVDVALRPGGVWDQLSESELVTAPSQAVADAGRVAVY